LYKTAWPRIRTTSIHRSIYFVLRVDEAIGDSCGYRKPFPDLSGNRIGAMIALIWFVLAAQGRLSWRPPSFPLYFRRLVARISLDPTHA
jgi:hypothetical protein